MRIAIIADPLDNQTAGVHTYTQNFVAALERYDHDNEYFLIRERKTGEFPRMKEIAIPNTRLPVGWASFRLFVLVPLVCRRLKVDAVVEPAHFGPWNLPRHIKRITVIHDLTPLLFPGMHRWHSQLLQRIFLRRIMKRADIVLANSNNTASDLIRFYPFTDGKVETIYLGRDSFFKPVDTTSALKAYNIEDTYLLFTGTIEPRKDLPTLLTAFEKFKAATESNVQLVIAGAKGWKTGGFEEALEQNKYKKDIVVTGYVTKTHLRELYSHCLCFIYPSVYEGFGFPVIEAMACGAPVIAAKNSSLTEVGGNEAIYFKTSDSEELFRQIKTLFNNRHTLGKEKAQHINWVEIFSWENYVLSFKKLLNK